MLTINLGGAKTLLNLLQRIHEGHPVSEDDLDEVLTANTFFVNFYSQWEGSDRDTIKKVVRHFNKPDQIPSEMLPTKLSEGFQQAVDEMDLMKGRLSWLKDVDPSNISENVLAFLPANTPLNSVIHITLDRFNNAFVHQGEMGVSLLMEELEGTFQEVVSHELHHVGFRFWIARDPVRQALLEEQSGRTIAVQHVQNLLAEGMANYYCTPGYVFRKRPKEPPVTPFQNRLDRLQREEEGLFAQAEEILTMSLDPEAEYEPCLKALKSIALDMEEALLPAGHYLGARLIQTMEKVHSRDIIVSCVRFLPEFLPLYNKAAETVGAHVFNPQLIDRFVHLWDSDVNN